MKVLYFHQYFSFPTGAAGTRSYEFAKELVNNGHKVTMVCASNDICDTKIVKKDKQLLHRDTIEGIDIVEIDLSYSNSDGFYSRVFKFVKFSLLATKFALFEDYDVAFATSTPLTISIPVVLARVFRGKPYIFEVRDLWPETPIAMNILRNPILIGLARLLESISYFCARSIIALSPGMLEGVALKSSRPRVLIPNGCDNNLFRPVHKKEKKLLGCDDDEFVCVFTGAHGKANGLDFILRVAEHALSVEPKIKFVLIGKGSEKNRLIAEAKEKHLENVLFLDAIPKNKLAEKLPHADLGLMLLADIKEFQYGTSPNKFFDYLSAGLPIAVNHKGWVSDMISENNCGLCSGDYKEENFLKIICKIKNDQQLKNKMSTNARRLALDSFDRDDLALEFRKHLETQMMGV